MKKNDIYLEAACTFATRVPEDQRDLAGQLRTWVENQAAIIRELCPPANLRCQVHITLPRSGGERVSCEFLTPSGRYHPILISSGDSNVLRGTKPDTIGLGASIELLALLTTELGVAVMLQP